MISKVRSKPSNETCYRILKPICWKPRKKSLLQVKKDLVSNGTIPITIKTLHGRFEFHVQRFIDRANPTSLDRTYFDWTDQFQEGYVSDRLKEFSAYYSNRLSYNEVAELIELNAH